MRRQPAGLIGGALSCEVIFETRTNSSRGWAISNFADPKTRRVVLWPTRWLKKSYY